MSNARGSHRISHTLLSPVRADSPVSTQELGSFTRAVLAFGARRVAGAPKEEGRMSTRNVRMLAQEIPAYQLARRARIDQLEHEAQSGSDHGLQMMGLLIVLCLAVWGCLLAWAFGGH